MFLLKSSENHGRKQFWRLSNNEFLADYVKFDTSLSERDHMGIRKTFSGLMKLIYPDKNITKEEVLELVDFAVEGRKRVKSQLCIIDETFRLEPAHFKYTILSTGEEVEVETLECLNLPERKTVLAEESLEKQASENSEKNNVVQSTSTPKRPRIALERKRSKNVTIRENQSGISYQTLFADYLNDATEITIEDPFIRFPYQIRNLIELLSLIIKLNKEDKSIKVHLVTNNDEKKIPESIDAFNDIQDSMADTSIKFTYEFKDFHDRKILTNTGWEIILGRGLDVFEKRSGYTIEDYVQEKRRCKDFNVTYIPKD